MPNIGILPYLASFYVIPHHFLDPTHYSFFTKKLLEEYIKKYMDVEEKNIEIEYSWKVFHFIDEPSMHYHIKAVIYFN